FRVALGRMSEMGYGMMFGSDVQKDFFLKQIKGRGYVDVGTSIISEFYTPLVPKGHDFLNAKYAIYQGKSKVQDNVRDLTSSISQTKSDRASGRKEQQKQRRKTIVERRAEMEKAKQNKQPASTTHTRPTTKQESYEKPNRQQEQVHVRPKTKQGKTYDDESTRPTTPPINKTKTQKEKQERPTGKGNPSNPKPERQNTIPKERPIHKSAVSSPA